MAWTSRTREAVTRPVSWLGPASTRTLYDVLGVRRDADLETINQAFRQAVKAHHPDVDGGEAAASEKFHDIMTAIENGLPLDSDWKALVALAMKHGRMSNLGFGPKPLPAGRSARESAPAPAP